MKEKIEFDGNWNCTTRATLSSVREHVRDVLTVLTLCHYFVAQFADKD